MIPFLQNLLTASIHGSVVILAVLLLRLVLWKTPRKYICLLWLLAGIRLLLPIEIRSDLSLQPEFSLPEVQWTFWLPWVWGGIAVCFGIYSLISYWKLKNQVREAVKIRGGWECDKIETAFILGFVKPKIYIPMGMDRQSRRNILAHERTHLDKGDHWIKMIGFVALALHWFNPLVWVAYILLCKDIEIACDERVIRFMELEERKAYSSALLRCSSRHAHFAASPVAFGEVSVKKRILSILNYKKPSFWLSLLGVVAFFFVAICLLTSPAEESANAPTPEQKAQAAKLEQCRQDLEALLTAQEFCYELDGTDARGSVQWTTRLCKQGDNTLWTYSSIGSEPTDGRMEHSGKHYVWYSGSWMETESADTRFAQWLDLIRWNPDTGEFVGETTSEDGRELVFTTHWEGEKKTVHTATVTANYSARGKLSLLRVEQPNYENTERLYLTFAYRGNLLGEEKSISDLFGEAEAAIVNGVVSDAELSSQAELSDWAVFFRVDDDRLSSKGADVYFSQGEHGRGTISTTEEYWLEKKVDGNWETLPTISTPKWEDKGFGVAKGNATYGYLDWTPIYGQLEPGLYRMGKRFCCYDQENRYSKEAPFYSEFQIYESVDASSPEAKAAVEHCYAKLEELKNRTSLHWKSIMGQDSDFETWTDGDNFLQVTHWPGPEVPEEEWSDFDKSLFPRTDTTVRYEGVGYGDIRENPEVPSSKALGLGISTLSPKGGGWDWMGSIAEDFNMSYFERGNHTISFPEGVGVVSADMVRFAEDWTIAGGMECGAVLTYQFDGNGDICYLEYQTEFEDGREYSASITIFEDTAEEIREKISSSVENLVVESFSWTEAEAKYTSGDFNIRQDSFVNTEGSTITGPVDAAKLALKEYPKLSNVYATRLFRDDSTGMWKVTFESQVEIQSTYEYRDVYLSDSGVTQLLVYEGPIRFDESRK